MTHIVMVEPMLQLDILKKKEIDTLLIEKFIVKVKHTIQYEEHVYIINKKVELDIKNNTISEESLNKNTYARVYFIYLIKKNQYVQLTKLETDFIKKYQIKEISTRADENIKIPVKKVINSAYLSLKRMNELNDFAYNNITELKDNNGNNIVETITCEYYKDNLKVKDKVYMIITQNMKNNLLNINADTIFVDCTYKIIPPGLKNYKFLVIIGYNNINNKLLLYLFALIRHENIQNFETIFNHLKIKFNFQSKIITSDYQKGQISAIIKCFPNSKLVLCWFHALKNIKNKIPFFDSKNYTEKQLSKDLISNIKLMFFIPETKIEEFYETIESKFNSKSYYKFFNI